MMKEIEFSNPIEMIDGLHIDSELGTGKKQRVAK